MFQGLLATRNDLTLTVVRLVLGIVFFVHGSQLVLGWFGGYGYTASMHMFTQQMGLPAAAAFLVILSQFLGGIGLIVGFLTRLAALSIVLDMLGAIFLVHVHVGFFMNWYGTLKGEGYEYHLLVLALCLILMVKGAGALSIDRFLYREERR